MSTTLKGKVIQGLKHTSQHRFNECRIIFAKRGILFPPFFLGTVNIKLPENFVPPDTDCVRLHVPRSEMVGQKESWDLIPVSHINGMKSQAYIYKTSTDYHGPDIVELIAHDLGESAKDGSIITIELPHSI